MNFHFTFGEASCYWWDSSSADIHVHCHADWCLQKCGWRFNMFSFLTFSIMNRFWWFLVFWKLWLFLFEKVSKKISWIFSFSISAVPDDKNLIIFEDKMIRYFHQNSSNFEFSHRKNRDHLIIISFSENFHFNVCLYPFSTHLKGAGYICAIDIKGTQWNPLWMCLFFPCTWDTYASDRRKE